MQKVAVLAVLSFKAMVSVAQTPLASPVPPKTQAWTAHYRNATISIGRILEAGGIKYFNVIGTALIVSPEGSKAFVVTAKHVFYEPDVGWHPSQLSVRLAKQENKSFTEELGIELPLVDAKTKKDLWVSLPDGSDIAAIPVTGPLMKLLTDAIGFQEFASIDDVYDGASVFTFGYPSDSQILIGPNGLVRAITRSGIIAWTDPNGPLDNPLLLDSNVLPGNSGGPAFKVPTGMSKGGAFEVGGRVAFLGVVTSTLKTYSAVEANGKIVQMKFPEMPAPSTEQVAVIGIGALGRIEPASKVKKLIESILQQN